MNRDLFLAILSMDSYQRGYDAGNFRGHNNFRGHQFPGTQFGDTIPGTQFPGTQY